MPNRMLRDWTCSDKIEKISVHAERFFTRLIMKVDDYGCFFADARLLKANLFPLLLDEISEADLQRWMVECQKAGLIILYEVSGKGYVQINDFKQRLDRAKSKFPLPPVNELPAIVNESPPEEKENTNTKREENCGLPPPESILVTYDVEEFVKKNQARYEQLVMKLHKTPVVASTSLHKYHLWLESNGKYPVNQQGVFAGFELWLMKEKKSNDPQPDNHEREQRLLQRQNAEKAKRDAIINSYTPPS